MGVKMTLSAPSEPPRTLPIVDDENRAFWTHGADGRLHIRRCRSCDNYIHPPLPRCAKCLSADVGDVVVSGRGTVESFTINQHRWLPGLKVPYVIALISLAEQQDIRLMTNIVNCPPEQVSIGATVRVVFERHDEVFLPMFQLEQRK
jgi:uncharacterized OB-fold protein